MQNPSAELSDSMMALEILLLRTAGPLPAGQLDGTAPFAGATGPHDGVVRGSRPAFDDVHLILGVHPETPFDESELLDDIVEVALEPTTTDMDSLRQLHSAWLYVAVLEVILCSPRHEAVVAAHRYVVDSEHCNAFQFRIRDGDCAQLGYCCHVAARLCAVFVATVTRGEQPDPALVSRLHACLDFLVLYPCEDPPPELAPALMDVVLLQASDRFDIRHAAAMVMVRLEGFDEWYSVVPSLVSRIHRIACPWEVGSPPLRRRAGMLARTVTAMIARWVASFSKNYPAPTEPQSISRFPLALAEQQARWADATTDWPPVDVLAALCRTVTAALSLKSPGQSSEISAMADAVGTEYCAELVPRFLDASFGVVDSIRSSSSTALSLPAVLERAEELASLSEDLVAPVTDVVVNMMEECWTQTIDAAAHCIADAVQHNRPQMLLSSHPAVRFLRCRLPPPSRSPFRVALPSAVAINRRLHMAVSLSQQRAADDAASLAKAAAIAVSLKGGHAWATLPSADIGALARELAPTPAICLVRQLARPTNHVFYRGLAVQTAGIFAGASEAVAELFFVELAGQLGGENLGQLANALTLEAAAEAITVYAHWVDVACREFRGGIDPYAPCPWLRDVASRHRSVLARLASACVPPPLCDVATRLSTAAAGLLRDVTDTPRDKPRDPPAFRVVLGMAEAAERALRFRTAIRSTEPGDARERSLLAGAIAAMDGTPIAASEVPPSVRRRLRNEAVEATSPELLLASAVQLLQLQGGQRTTAHRDSDEGDAQQLSRRRCGAVLTALVCQAHLMLPVDTHGRDTFQGMSLCYSASFTRETVCRVIAIARSLCRASGGEAIAAVLSPVALERLIAFATQCIELRDDDFATGPGMWLIADVCDAVYRSASHTPGGVSPSSAARARDVLHRLARGCLPLLKCVSNHLWPSAMRHAVNACRSLLRLHNEYLRSIARDPRHRHRLRSHGGVEGPAVLPVIHWAAELAGRLIAMPLHATSDSVDAVIMLQDGCEDLLLAVHDGLVAGDQDDDGGGGKHPATTTILRLARRHPLRGSKTSGVLGHIGAADFATQWLACTEHACRDTASRCRLLQALCVMGDFQLWTAAWADGGSTLPFVDALTLTLSRRWVPSGTGTKAVVPGARRFVSSSAATCLMRILRGHLDDGPDAAAIQHAPCQQQRLRRWHHCCVNVLYQSGTTGNPHALDVKGRRLSRNLRVIYDTLVVLLHLHHHLGTVTTTHTDGSSDAGPLPWSPHCVAQHLCAAVLERDRQKHPSFDADERLRDRIIDDMGNPDGPEAVFANLPRNAFDGEDALLHRACALQCREFVRVVVAFIALVVCDQPGEPPAEAHAALAEVIMPMLAGRPKAVARVLLPSLGAWQSPQDADAIAGGVDAPAHFVAAFGGQDGRVRRQRFLAVAADPTWLGEERARTFVASVKAAMAELASDHDSMSPSPRRARAE